MSLLNPRKFYLELFLLQWILTELFEVIMLSGSPCICSMSVWLVTWVINRRTLGVKAYCSFHI
jgi:hypothetical protein